MKKLFLLVCLIVVCVGLSAQIAPVKKLPR